MKQILLLLLIPFFGFSQTVLTEDFEGGTTFPTTSGWTVEDLAIPANSEVWAIENTGEAGGFTAGNTFVYDSGGAGNYATFDSDGYGDNGTAEESTLTSPVFDCSALTSVNLRFVTVYNGNFGGLGEIEVFNGTSWITVQTYDTAPSNTPSTTVAGVQIFDVSQLAGVSNAQIRFRWTGNWSISWSIDNIEVFQCTDAVPGGDATATNPADGAVDVPINYGTDNSIGPFEWSDPTTGAPDSYNISLGTTSTGDDIGELTDFSSGGTILYDFQPNTLYYWKVTALNCAGETESQVFSFTTAACTETSAPIAATSPGPSDMATMVQINQNGGLSFTWTGGSPDETYELNIGTANPPTQTIPVENGDVINGLAVSTQYFWSITSHNCFGSTTSPVWSFTTDSVLSVLENELEIVGIYPNPTSDYLNIRSKEELNSVEVFNLVGEKVKTFTKSQIIDNQINISDLKEGVYMVRVVTDSTSKVIKIIKE